MAVAVALMIVSISGQVQVLQPTMDGFAFLYAIAHDCAAILALDALMTAAAGAPVRKWAWFAILLAATPGAMLNAWHVIHGHSVVALPLFMGMVIGVGPIVLLLVLSHLIGLVVTASREQRKADREVPTARSDREVAAAAPRGATASPPAVTASPTASLVASVGTSDREVGIARSRSVAAASREAVPTVRQAVTPAPSPSAGALPGPRPDWMSAALVASVVKSMRATGHPRPRYGETRLVRDHQLDDGSKIGSDRAKKVLAYINNHELWREPA